MNTESQSTPKRPYLLRAYYDWLLDNNLTPYLVVDATYQGTEVPIEYVKDGQIILNLSPNAVGNLNLGNHQVQFSARFQGIARNIIVPLGAALAIYARENGDGVMFEPESYYDNPTQIETIKAPNTINKQPKDKKSTASHLRIVK